MIPLALTEIAEVVSGTVTGDPTVTVTAPAVLDSQQSTPGGLFVAVTGSRTDGHHYAARAGEAGAVAVLGSRPTELPTVVVNDVQAALQALAAQVVARLRPGLGVVAVTGSQGKTSTKDMIAAILEPVAPTVATFGSLNNELGVPLTMLRVDAATRHLVLEMGARHVGDIAALTRLAAPDVAVVLNVGEAHLGEFGSRAAIASAKGELVQGMAQGGSAILNADDPRVLAMRSLTDGPVLTFGRAADADVRLRHLRLDRSGRPSFTLCAADDAVDVSLPIVGAHQAVNAAAAAAAGLVIGVPLKVSAPGLATASVSKWRLERQLLPSGTTLLNDSYNANPHSTRAALDALASIATTGRRVAVLGEMLELGEESDAAHVAIGAYAAAHADAVVVVGDGARPIAEGAGARAVTLPDNSAAAAWLRDHLTEGDVVLVKASRGARLDEVAAALSLPNTSGSNTCADVPRRSGYPPTSWQRRGLLTADMSIGARADPTAARSAPAPGSPRRPRSMTGLVVYGCGTDEAALFRELAPRFGVSPTLTQQPVTERTAHLAVAKRCVSVGHKTQVTHGTLRALSHAGVRYVSTRSVGYDHIDVAYAARLGITVGNVSYSPDSVADYTLMLILMTLRHARTVVRRTDLHDYRLNETRGRELRDLTVGVIGTGHIGSAVIDRLSGFGCRIQAHDRRSAGPAEYVPLDTLLQHSDIVTLHTPLTRETHHLLDTAHIQQLKPGAVVINTGRGALIETEALVDALEAGRLGGAALDVVEGEDGIFYTDRRDAPIRSDLWLRLHALPNVLITPHTAYYTDHALHDTVQNTLINCVHSLSTESGHQHD